MTNQELIKHAKNAMKHSYAPYSKFNVGAALLTTSGNVYGGCNVENASYPAGICAERTALVKAISSGEQSFQAIAIVGSGGDFTYPCGICRQFMAEFGLDVKIILENGSEMRETAVRELLPEAFTAF